MPKKPAISPHVSVYGPVALEREVQTDRQARWDEETLIWGDADDLPLRILNAVNKSPTTMGCLDATEAFISGSGFTDEGLMNMVVDKDGTTLWELHCQLAQSMTYLESFGVNFKFDQKGRITNSYHQGPECLRFVKSKTKKIETIKHNPYFGTAEYKIDFTTCYPVFDISKVEEQVQTALETGEYGGQMYFWGTTRPPYKFYPIPKYWTGEKWIYVDAGIQEFHKENMDNGFFQSVLFNIIGDPNQKSRNPKYMKLETQTDGSTKRVPDKTIGEELDDQMSKKFAGTKKAGGAMVFWSQNADSSVKITAFPVNAQFDVLAGTFQDAIKGICIATKVDPILLALQGNGLINSGDSARAVIEYMQSKVVRHQKVLENFYNTIMLPNLQTKTQAKVVIKNYSPISLSVTVEDKFWEVFSDAEKKEYVKKNVPGAQEIIKDPPQVVDPQTGEPLTPEETQLSEGLSKLSMIEIVRIQGIVNRFRKGLLTIDVAKQLIKAKGLTDLEINTWLGVEPTE